MVPRLYPVIEKFEFVFENNGYIILRDAVPKGTADIVAVNNETKEIIVLEIKRGITLEFEAFSLLYMLDKVVSKIGKDFRAFKRRIIVVVLSKLEGSIKRILEEKAEVIELKSRKMIFRPRESRFPVNDEEIEAVLDEAR